VQRGNKVDKTTIERQRRYREQISKGKRKRLQIVLDATEAEKLDEICTNEGLNKTEFVRQSIKNWNSN